MSELKKAISLALFGYNQPKNTNCFDHISYVRGLLMHIRMNRLVYPGWDVVLNTDGPTFKAYADLFAALPIKVHINEPAPLTKAMLWRMKPVFDYNNYSHVICRDLDSPPTYREAQCVQEWINSDLAAHAITDSISHGIPMMGGLVGFRPQYWPMRTELQHWTDMFKDNQDSKYNWSEKGMDQTYLNAEIYPKFANPGAPAIMQHYILGHPNTFLPGYRNQVPDISVDGVGPEMAESNDCCSHMGQAGWLLPQTFRLFVKYKDRFSDILEAEKQHAPDVAYWVKDGTFD